MFKVFSFVVIFISSFVFAHPNISQKALDQARQDLAGTTAESKRLQDRSKIFCRGVLENPIGYLSALEDSFKKECEETQEDSLIKIRKKRDTLVQQIKEIQNNSPEYREYQMLLKEYNKLGYDVPYYLTNLGERIHPEIVHTSAKKVFVAVRNWKDSSQFKTYLDMSREALYTTKKLEFRCKGLAKREKVLHKLRNSLGALQIGENDECYKSKDKYLSHLPQVHDARKRFEEMEKLFQEHEEQHEQEERESTSGTR